jgi:hypothetical protein
MVKKTYEYIIINGGIARVSEVEKTYKYIIINGGVQE